MVLSKKTMIISASAASLVLLIAVVAFVWLRMAKLPSAFNIAAEADKKNMAVGAFFSELPECQVSSTVYPPPPPTIVEIESKPPVSIEKPLPPVESPDVTKQTIPPQSSEIVEKIDKPKPAPKVAEIKPIPETAPPKAVPSLKKEPKKKKKPKLAKDFLFSVQIGAFLEKKNADERMTILKQMGLSPFGYSARDKRGNMWHTVRIGHYVSLKEARKDLTRIRKSSPFNAIIIGKGTLSPLKKNK